MFGVRSSSRGVLCARSPLRSVVFARLNSTGAKPAGSGASEAAAPAGEAQEDFITRAMRLALQNNNSAGSSSPAQAGRNSTRGRFGRDLRLRNVGIQSMLGGEFQADPREMANKLKYTGPTAGRLVRVTHNNIAAAQRQLNTLVNVNKIKSTYYDQRFHIKPCKVKLAKRIANSKKHFNQEFKKLMNNIWAAKRRGY